MFLHDCIMFRLEQLRLSTVEIKTCHSTTVPDRAEEVDTPAKIRYPCVSREGGAKFVLHEAAQ